MDSGSHSHSDHGHAHSSHSSGSHGHDAGHHSGHGHGDVASNNHVSVHTGEHGAAAAQDYSCHSAVADFQHALGQAHADMGAYVDNVVDNFHFGAVGPIAQDLGNVYAADTQMGFYCSPGE